jgi:hypothetical protein
MRTGVMAPPTLYQLPPQPGLMAPAARAEPLELSLRSFLWCAALVLGLVELLVQAAGPA